MTFWYKYINRVITKYFNSCFIKLCIHNEFSEKKLNKYGKKQEITQIDKWKRYQKHVLSETSNWENRTNIETNDILNKIRALNL